MLYKSPYASQVRRFLQDLDFEVLQSIASTATDRKIEVSSNKEAIDVILLHTRDLDRFFSYRRLTAEIFSKYLIMLQMRNKKLEIPMKSSRMEMIFTIKDLWVKCVNRNRQKKRKDKKRKNLQKLPVSDQKPKENDSVDDIKHIEISVSIASQSEVFNEKQLVEPGERKDLKDNCPTKNKCRRNLRSASRAAGKLTLGIKETFKNRGDSDLKSEFVGESSVQQSSKDVGEAQRPLKNQQTVCAVERSVEKVKPPVNERAAPINVTNIFNTIAVGVPSASNFQFTLDTSLTSTSSTSVRSDKFARDFCEWFYKMMNKLQPICAHEEGDVFSERVFVGNSSVHIFMMSSVVVERKGTDQTRAYHMLKNTLLEFELLFSPNMESGLQIIRGEHGSIKVFCCGNLHKHNTFIGIYEQEFDLVFCPVDKLWKILCTKLNLKHATVATQMPSLPPCEIFEMNPS
ncbi:uncharacterized protein LOC125036709 [Penaeus chinensis]|uniref:uncharacterized protein LOC125036709 n=1 Tax=Penaeus chinensis TaxID=139456 RepID=UPI001FB820D1|nr:uncharacterized protein LOC125036709 [Penaeus chinensis]